VAYTQLTRAQVRTLAYQRLDNNTTLWRTDEVNRLINEALRTWNALTGYWKVRVGPIATVANQVFYSLPGTIVNPGVAQWNGKSLNFASLFEMDYSRRTWQSDTTTSGGEVPDEPKIWCPVGLTQFAIWPADAVAGNSLIFDGVATTPVMSADTDFIDIGSDELQSILDYVQHLAAFKEGGVEHENTGLLFKNFLKAAADRNGLLLANNAFRGWMGLDKREQQVPQRRREGVGAR
jgi:hypothetical protein